MVVCYRLTHFRPMKRALLTLALTSLLATTALADPIHDAAYDGDLAGVQAELDKGADVNAKNESGVTPLLWAAWKGHKEVAELLIANGADVNSKNDRGMTPLHQAALGGHKEIAELLLANGAGVNAIIVSAPFQGKTPLDWANGETADLLRKHGGKTGEELQAEGN